MGVDLDSEQIHELQKFIEQQNIDLDDAEESEAELDSELQQQLQEQAGHDDDSSSSKSSGNKKKK